MILKGNPLASYKPKHINWRIVTIALVADVVLTPIYYTFGRMLKLNIEFLDVFSCTSSLAVALVIGYQLFFLVQFATLGRQTQVVFCTLDTRIPFVVEWVWIYGGFYYGLIGIPVVFIKKSVECFDFITGGLVLLMLLSPIYLLFPTSCPSAWRRFEVHNASGRFLKFIQSFDNGRTCLPSLHCVLAAYSASFLPTSPFSLLIPVLVSISCVFVKQHSVLEIIPSLVIGYLWGWVVKTMF
jgi:hypothetical protein